MLTALTTLRGIGPATADSLNAVGIADAETLIAMGADAAYERLIAAGERPHFIGYYALHMSVQGRAWNDCKGAEKAALRVRFDELLANMSANAAQGTLPARLMQELDRIGLVRPRTD